VISLNDFKSEPEELIVAQVKAAERVIRSGRYVLGQELLAFENAFGSWLHAPHVAGVGNGTDAIEIGLRAMGIGMGDEVITTSMTAFATVLAITRAGATPVLADILPNGLLDMKSVERCITRKTKAVLLVHLYGHISLMDEWQAFCSGHGILLLEDCAQAHGAKWGGKSAGLFGAFGAFSFYPTKNLGARGDGGAIVTADPELDRKARSLRNYGQRDRYVQEFLGLNSRLDEIQAAILSERMPWIDRFVARRRQIASVYNTRLSNPRVGIAIPQFDENHAYHLYVVNCTRREELSHFLQDHGIQSLIHYPIPIHHQEPTKNIRKDPLGLPIAEHHAATCLSIPCGPQMSDEDVGHVVDVINDYYEAS
jgi:dTDP-4-amino-4,6-dideoxygalactose transaminase